MAKIIKVKVIQTPEQLPDSKESFYRKWNFRLVVYSFILSVILAIVAVWVLYLSREQTKASIESVKLANSVFKDSKAYNESVIEQQKLRDSINKINDEKRFTLDSINIASQLSSLLQTQTQFELENEPFVELTNFAIKDENLFSFNIKNYGKYPILYDELSFVIDYEPENGLAGDRLILKRLLLNDVNKVGVVVVAGDTTRYAYLFNKPDSAVIDRIKQTNGRILIGGHLAYINLINNKRTELNFTLRTDFGAHFVKYTKYDFGPLIKFKKAIRRHFDSPEF